MKFSQASGQGELLLEIGTEELPSGVLSRAIKDLEEISGQLLLEARIPAAEIKVFATPRRLVLLATGIPAFQTSLDREVAGPPRSAAYDASGKPTAAAVGFAKSQGISLENLTIKKTGKGEYVFAINKEPTLPAKRVLSDVLPRMIRGMVFPKTMRWNGEGFRFSRPVRWIVSLFNGKVVPFHIAGLKSSNRSRGHRFFSKKPITVTSWKDYKKKLLQNHVLVDQGERRKIISGGIDRLARLKKGMAAEDESLLNEAVFVTEDPVVLIGEYDKSFLELPAAVPVTAMKEHQGYFPVRNKKGNLLPFFIFVANGKKRKPEVVRTGNERVLRARLEDARFYFEQDRKIKLEELVTRLSDLLFHEKLGSVYLKTGRIGKLAGFLAGEVNIEDSLAKKIERAAMLCKTDLLTGMVREFPTLQGIMGREYGLLQGEDPEVAEAIAEHHYPRFSDDPGHPRTQTGKLLTAADRLDTLVGFFGVSLAPSGSLDPFGLRRQGFGLNQILIDELFSNFSLKDSVQKAVALYKESGITLGRSPGEILDDLENFLVQRMTTYLRRRTEETQPYRKDLADAVLAESFNQPLDAYKRYMALLFIQNRAEFEPLIVSFKRASRILPAGFSGKVQEENFREPVEKTLYGGLVSARRIFEKEMDKRNYPDALQSLSLLRDPIDKFFEGVMVMDPDKSVRENRLALLLEIKDLFSRYGDFTKIAVEEA